MRLVLQSDSANSVFEGFDVEVDDQGEAVAGYFEIRDGDGSVDGCDGFDCFKLDDDGVGDEEVEAGFADGVAFVVERYGELPFEGDLSEREFNGQSGFVRRFKMTRAKPSMDLNCSPN